MKYHIDTNICIYALKNVYPSLKERFLMHKAADIVVPAIVKAELLFGAEKSSSKARTLASINEFLKPFQIIEFGDSEASWYAKVRHELEKRGEPIGANDLIIAAGVLCRNDILVTHNIEEYSRIPGLRVQDWAA